MLILVANLGSTSFKYKLFRMPDERLVASGSADRVGQGGSTWSVKAAGAETSGGTTDLADHADAIELHLKQLVELGAIDDVQDVEAIGFKAVHGGPISGAVRVDDEVLATMERFSPLAPAHNPPYIEAMKSFRERLPGVGQVAAFETAFHQTVPKYRQVYATPWDWIEEHGIRRYGFHGASHRYIAERMQKLAKSAGCVISLHLGGSCSICAIDGGDSVANSLGTTPQTGVFHNNRVGDFDAFAMLKLIDAGLDTDAIFEALGKRGGLLGLSGVSADMREVEQAAAGGNERAQLAVDAFVDSCRQYVGAYMAVLRGADAIVFTGGIGQHGAAVRAAICDGFGWAGVKLDRDTNAEADGNAETRIDAGDGKDNVQVWVVPTNEELIVARQTQAVLATADV